MPTGTRKERKEYVVYCATCTVNNKKYIGQSYDFEERKQIHFRMATKPQEGRGRSAFHNAINKYGCNAFVWSIISKHKTLNAVNRAEERTIIKLGTLAPGGYNLKKGGDNHEQADEVKKRISKTLKKTSFFVGKKGKDHPAFGQSPTQKQRDHQSLLMSGENGPVAKLTEKKARSIYRQYMYGATMTSLAKEFSLKTEHTIRNILNKKCWKNATKDYPNVDTTGNRGNIGANHSKAKLTEYQVIDILDIANNMIGTRHSKCVVIAKEYNVSIECITGILSGKNWKHIPR